MTPEKDSLTDLTRLQEKMNRLFTESVKKIKEIGEPDESRPWSPAVDVYDLPTAFVLMAEVPGVPRESISIEVQGDLLVLTGDRPVPAQAASGSPYRSERRYGRFERTFSLPVHLDGDLVKARLDEGVLTVTIEKPAAETRRVRVDIG